MNDSWEMTPNDRTVTGTQVTELIGTTMVKAMDHVPATSPERMVGPTSYTQVCKNRIKTDYQRIMEQVSAITPEMQKSLKDNLLMDFNLCLVVD